MKKLLALAVLLSGLYAAPALAKEGLYISGYVPYDDLSSDIVRYTGVDGGLGIGVRAGVGMGRYFALEGSVFRSNHDMTNQPSANFEGLTGAAKLNLPVTGTEVIPYLLLGIGEYRLKNGTSTYKGEGIFWGAGIYVTLAPELSLNFGWSTGNIDFDGNSGFNQYYGLLPLPYSLAPSKVGGDLQTFEVGITYHFI